MKLRAVVDTNVLVSGLLGGTATEVMRRWRAGTFDLMLSTEILTEYEAVLNRAKFKLPSWVVHELLDYIRARAEWVAPTTVLSVEIRDPADAKFLQAALDGKADLIITEDKDLLDLGGFQQIRIVPPWEFLALL
jgi:putative PIN family toxin of toxin-antitoxin system